MSAPVRPLEPAEILALAPAELDALLDRLEASVPRRPPIVALPAGVADSAWVFGDSHGDWRSTEEVVRRYRAGDHGLIGLGDYIDRAPADCGPGSTANALYLLGLTAADPERVFLIQGNHETTRRLAVLPHDLPRELERQWGPDPRRYDRLLALLERGPLAVSTANGAYLAHAGFPRGTLPTPWVDAFRHPDDARLSEIVWAECDASRVRRGAAPPWGARDLDRFLEQTGLAVVLRGHDPDLTGRPVYAARCLTLHTCRFYERYGGVIAAELPLRTPLRSVAELKVDHLSTEGRSFGAP
ncbi:MAG TPA: metallophosphoesterase [Thermoplasmata archaeon]|nr:metallophosphoesterase [Thermoplasmata archaeon]